MPTATRDWVSQNMAKPQHRASSPFGEDLTRVHPAQNGDHQPAWLNEKSLNDIAIPRETLQKIYLSPPINVNGDFRNIFVSSIPPQCNIALLMGEYTRQIRHLWVWWGSS